MKGFFKTKSHVFKINFYQILSPHKEKDTVQIMF